MYNEDDFRNLLGGIANKNPEEFLHIRDRIKVLVGFEKSKINGFGNEKKLRLLREVFFEDFKKLSAEEISDILNLFGQSSEGFSVIEINEFSQAISSFDEEKISLILNHLDPSLKKGFFRKIVHGDCPALIAKNNDKIIAVLGKMNLQLQQMLLTEINFVDNRNFFDDFVFINKSNPQKISQMLNCLHPDLWKKLFTQKDSANNKSFFDKFLSMINFDHELVSAVINGLQDDLKAMVFCNRDERGFNPLESALIEMSKSLFATRKHHIITKLRPLKDIQDSWLQKLEKQDLGLSEMIDVTSFYEAFIAIDMLERIYQQTDVSLAPSNTSGNLDLIYKILSQSKTANNPQNKVFLDAINAIKDQKVGENIHILDANHIDHNAYFVVKCDINNFPIKISYIDGWGGIFGKNSNNYSFGVVEFEIDSSKIFGFEDLSQKLTNFFEGKKYPSKEEMNLILSNIVKCDEQNIPIIINKNIPTKIQKRNNCHLKSALLLMREIAENIDPTLEFLVNQRKWSPEFEKEGFLEFDQNALSGSGRDLYKKFRNDFIDEQISVLANICDKKIPPFLSKLILSCLENIKSKTEQKQIDIQSEYDESTESNPIILQKIYKNRLEIINKSIADLTKSPKRANVVESAIVQNLASRDLGFGRESD